MPFTEYADYCIQSLLFGDTTFTIPPNWFVGLSSTSPTQNDGGNYWNVTEPSGNSYSRVEVPNTTSYWTAAGGLTTASSTGGWTVQNLQSVTFPASSGAWLNAATLRYFFLADYSGSLNPGAVNVWLYGALNPTYVVSGSGIVISFGVGQLTATLD